MIELKGLPKLRKLSVLSGLPDLFGRRRRPALPELPTIAVDGENISPEEERRREIARLVGDDGLSYRVMKLQAEHPNGTVPELVTMDWLQRQAMMYSYQVDLFGGRRGGLIPDFVVQNGAQADAWLVQGEYFHTRHGKVAADAADKLRLRGAEFNGSRIQNVIEVWDSRILNRTQREQTFQAARAGQEMGR